MKKHKKWTRVLALVFAIGMLMSVTGYAEYDFKSEFELSVPSEVRQAMEAQQPALDAYQNLWNSFPKTELGEPLYPEEYAGEYIDPERDYKLVIMLTNVSAELQQKYI